MQKNNILPIVSSVFITLAFIALLVGSKKEIKTDDAILSQNDFDYTIKSQIKKIKAIELAQFLKDQSNYYRLFDLRTKENYETYHLPTSEQLNIDDLFSKDLKINNRIILVDHYEEKSIQAYYLLNIRGYYDVSILRGGINAWKNQVLFPLENRLTNQEIKILKDLTPFFGGTFLNDSTSSGNRTIKSTPLEKSQLFQIGC